MFEYGKFRFVEASSDNLKDVFRLRYEVYAMEFGFENPRDFPDKLEKDKFDDHSVHFVALNRFDEVIGTVRMILNSKLGFPVEHASKITDFHDKPENDKITEVSRLAVSKTLRRRPEDGIHGVESYIPQSQGGISDVQTEDDELKNRRQRPVIVLGLYKTVYDKCKELGISHMYMITEDKLYYALKKFGFIFSQVGKSVEYHGKRTPYATSWEVIEKYMLDKNPDILKFLLYGLKDEMVPDYLKEFKARIASPQ